jgi:hypothetical protein
MLSRLLPTLALALLAAAAAFIPRGEASPYVQVTDRTTTQQRALQTSFPTTRTQRFDAFGRPIRTSVEYYTRERGRLVDNPKAQRFPYQYYEHGNRVSRGRYINPKDYKFNDPSNFVLVNQRHSILNQYKYESIGRNSSNNYDSYFTNDGHQELNTYGW